MRLSEKLQNLLDRSIALNYRKIYFSLNFEVMSQKKNQIFEILFDLNPSNQLIKLLSYAKKAVECR